MCIIRLTFWSLPLLWGVILILSAAVAAIAWQLAKIKRELLLAYELDCLTCALDKAIEELKAKEDQTDKPENADKPCEK